MRCGNSSDSGLKVTILEREPTSIPVRYDEKLVISFTKQLVVAMAESTTVGLLHSVHNATVTIHPVAQGFLLEPKAQWHLIDWQKAMRIVKNLQARIVKVVEVTNPMG